MRKEIQQLVKGSLMHDIGKPAYRATGKKTNHSTQGYDFAKNELEIKDKEILNQILYHHNNQLKTADLPEDSLAYITYIADNISSATDRRDKDDGGNGFTPKAQIESVFNLISGKEVKFPTGVLETTALQPEENPKEYDRSFYTKLMKDLKEELKGVEDIDTVMNILEKYLTYIPSSTQKDQVADINLYEHCKLTAAIAACIYYYGNEKDYKKAYLNNATSFYKKEAFRIVRMDLIGAKKFIGNVYGTENALKNARGRSFYIQAMFNHFIDSYLEKLGLFRTNCLFIDGETAYFLIPNTEEATDASDSFEKEINQWLLTVFETDLFLSCASESCSAKNLEDIPAGSYADIMKRLKETAKKKDRSRYRAEDILFLNRRKKEGRECKRCHRTEPLNDENLCPLCSHLERFSKSILCKDVYYVNEGKSGVQISENCYLSDKPKNPVRIYSRNNGGIRVYHNAYSSGETIKDLVAARQGIKRLGAVIIKADNVKEAFLKFPDEYASLSRWTTFTKSIARYFKYHAEDLLQCGEYYMDRMPGSRSASVVYTGGDEIFVIGAWNDIVEFTLDFQKGFSNFVSDTVHLSAGLSMFHESYPIRYIMDETRRLLETSKEKGGNRITIFMDSESYRWEDFFEIMNDKFRKVLKFFNRSERGKNFIYHILNYLREMDGEKVNLPRFLYTIARLKPEEDDGHYEEFAKDMYKWVLNRKDIKQIILALTMYVYLTREENNYGGNE